MQQPWQTISHLAHANDFYVMIVESVRAANFNEVALHRELPGWKRMAETDAEVARCASLVAALDCFERAYERMLVVLNSLSPEELDRSFILHEQRTTSTTTLRQRVITLAGSHMREHLPQLAETLGRWRAAHP